MPLVNLYNLTTSYALTVKRIKVNDLQENTADTKRNYISILDFLKLFKK